MSQVIKRPQNNSFVINFVTIFFLIEMSRETNQNIIKKNKDKGLVKDIKILLKKKQTKSEN